MAIGRTAQDAQRRTHSAFGRIGVLMGGASSERNISLKSGIAVYEALKGLGLDVAAIDTATDSPKENTRLIKSYKIECAFLALHGCFGEDGGMQEVLDSIKIPYTGSGVKASRLAMDKIASRKVIEAQGLRAPAYKVLEREIYKADWKKEINFSFPWVIKPAGCGSSIGLSVVDDSSSLDKAVDSAFKFDQRVLVEQFIKGRELTVGILDNLALPVIEVIPKNRFFDYEAKYKTGMTDYLVPAELPEALAKDVQGQALRVHKLLGCFGCSRVDIILDKQNTAFMLELNSIPGFTETSLLPKAAKAAGVGFAELCIRLIKLAYERA